MPLYHYLDVMEMNRQALLEMQVVHVELAMRSACMRVHEPTKQEAFSCFSAMKTI